jgi:phage shock protein PspC (stress-responsive transcriptional regulator)
MKPVNNAIKKDKQNALISGVCAGIAKKFGAPILAVRVIAVLVGLSMPLAAAVAYAIAVVLLTDH